MSDPREAQRERDLHELFVARSEFATAFLGMPDAELGVRRAADEYAYPASWSTSPPRSTITGASSRG
jgi:hypothetical protein